MPPRLTRAATLTAFAVFFPLVGWAGGAQPPNTGEAGKGPQAEGKSDPGPGPAPNAPGGGADVDAQLSAFNATRKHMLDNVRALQALEREAREKKELDRLRCIQDKQGKAAALLDEVVVPTVNIFLEPGTSGQDREVLKAEVDRASEELDKLVEQAKACSGTKGPEGAGVTVNAVDLERFIPWLDPTRQPEEPPVPPGVDPTRPVITQSPTM